MSAIEQPAPRSGRITRTDSSVRMSARLGHEVDAAEDDVFDALLVGGLAGELEAVAGEVGEVDDRVLLVVVAEDHELGAQGLLGGLDAQASSASDSWCRSREGVVARLASSGPCGNPRRCAAVCMLGRYSLYDVSPGMCGAADRVVRSIVAAHHCDKPREISPPWLAFSNRSLCRRPPAAPSYCAHGHCPQRLFAVNAESARRASGTRPSSEARRWVLLVRAQCCPAIQSLIRRTAR